MYADYAAEHTTAVPKLEDFLGGDTTASYTSQTEAPTQDESSQLTHLYEPHHAAANYFADHHHHHHQDLKSFAENGFQSAAANSGSEVDDSCSVGRVTQLSCAGSEFVGQSIETELVAGFAAVAAGASAAKSSEKALVSVAVDSDSAKKISDTFGQRTSIYRGVTRLILSFFFLCGKNEFNLLRGV